MNWILEHLQLVIVVASAFAWWLTQRKAGAAEEPSDEERRARPEFDPEVAERTRRIQEDIRRKIAERRGGAELPPVPEPPPVPPRFERPVLVETPPRREPEWSFDDVAALERQRRLEEQVQALARQRREMLETARAVPVAVADAPRRAVAPAARTEDRRWLEALRDRRNLRQAVVLREVLGPPAALR